MARPKNKSDLIQQSEGNYQKLINYIMSFPEEIRLVEFPEGTMNRNIRDVLAHLHEWHKMFLKWHDVGMRGEKPAIPAQGYTWKTTPELNRKIWEQNNKYELTDILKWLKQSHQDIMSIILEYSDEELFEKKRYPWTGSTSLGAYLISSTSSHYSWAFKLIKQAMRVNT